MDAIAFESAPSTVFVRNPLRGFALEQQQVEVRRDPLLGGTSVLNPFLAGKTGFFGVNDRAFIARLVEESARNCVFCPEGLETKAAKYPEELVPGGRIEVGEATLIPNLFALGAYHPVIVLSQAHYLELDGFTPPLLADGLLVSREFVRSVQRRDPQAACTFLGANYLFPAGASIIHPHLQMLVTPQPYSRHARLLEACRAHRERHGSSLLLDLAQEEQRRGERFIGRLGGWRWFAAFAPQGCNEVQAVHEDCRDIADLPDEEVRALAAGISAVLAVYAAQGLLCFNWGLHAARAGAAAAGFRCFLRIVSRQNLSPAYRNDDYFLQKLLEADVVITPPESLAALARPVFAARRA